jgi:hypothetical protein
MALLVAPLAIIPGLDGACPDLTALASFRHLIAYERTEEAGCLKGLSIIHTDVWTRGPDTGFYVRERPPGFAASVRMTYLFGKDGLRGGGTCPVDRNWRKCIEGFAETERTNDVVITCSTTINIRGIPPWEPSPNDQSKRRVAAELRLEIEAQWPGVQQIAVRDFNLNDDQITMYLKMPDGDYYQGAGFHAMRKPHLEGWHLFGQAPLTSIRKWIFERSYKLK